MHPARLGDVADSMKNGMYKPASEYGDDGIPCLRMYNIDAGGIVWRDIKRMRVTDAERVDYGLLEGDLLVNRVNSRELVGKTALIPSGMEPSVFESKNIRLRLRADKARSKFINYQLLASGRHHFAGNAQQVVGMASISQTQLADFPIFLTSLEHQDEIIAELDKQFSRLDEAVANLQRVKANLKRYKASVLKDAVEGRLVPLGRQFVVVNVPRATRLQRPVFVGPNPMTGLTAGQMRATTAVRSTRCAACWPTSQTRLPTRKSWSILASQTLTPRLFGNTATVLHPARQTIRGCCWTTRPCSRS